MLVDRDASGPVSRTLSAGLAVTYLVFVAREGSPADLLKMAAFCLLPLACIWFPDVLGDYTGFGLGGGMGVTSTSPAPFVRALGWVVLALPLIAAALIAMRS